MKNFETNHHKILALWLTIIVATGGIVVGGELRRKTLSEVEIEATREAALEFAERNSEMTESAIEDIRLLTVESVRFSRYYGYIANGFTKDYSFRVSINLSSEDPRLVSFKNKLQRNILEDCNSNRTYAEAYVSLEAALNSAHRFLESQGLRQFVSELSKERESLSCLGSEEYFQFVWREPYDENGVASMLARVEVLINPVSSKVYSFNHTFSVPKESDLLDFVKCRAAIQSMKQPESGFVFERMVLYSNYEENGMHYPAWAVTLRTTDDKRDKETVLFVDAKSGEILDN